MAHQGNRPAGRTKVPVVKIATLSVPKKRLAREALDHVISNLALPNEAAQGRLRKMLRALETQYRVGRSIGSRYLSGHQAKAAFEQISALLGDVLGKLEKLSPQHSTILDANIQQIADGAPVALTLPRSQLVLKNLQHAASEAAVKYRPPAGRPADPHLAFTIGTLMLLFEGITGKRAKVSLTRDGAHCPRLVSPEAKAIGAFMTAVDPSLTETAIVNKIHEVLKATKGGDLSRYRAGLLVGERLTITPC